MSARPIELSAEYRASVPRSWKSWLDELPDIIAAYLEEWGLVITGEFPLAAAFVAPVERLEDGRACVLKVQPTGRDDIEGAERELIGLRLGAPYTVEVVAEDARAGVLLLARAQPGESLIDLADKDDDLATETLAGVIKNYCRPIDDPLAAGLRWVGEHRQAFEKFDRGPHGTAARMAMVKRDATLFVKLGMDEIGSGIPGLREARRTAERVLDELEADNPAPWLLHGDFHHGNVVMDQERGLLIIDPWAMYGDRTRDVAMAMGNPLDLVAQTEDLAHLFGRRIPIYADVLGLDRERLAAWCYVQSVISALWGLEDGYTLVAGDPRLRVIATLRALI